MMLIPREYSLGVTQLLDDLLGKQEEPIEGSPPPQEAGDGKNLFPDLGRHFFF